MFNKTEFIVQMKRAGYTQITLAHAMGINSGTLNRKLRTGDFRRNEIALIAELLGINSARRIYEIFFTPDPRLRDNQIGNADIGDAERG